MRNLIISLAVVGLLLSGCVHCGPCPKQDVLIKAATPYGTVILLMEKGTLDEENRGRDWIPAPKEPEKPEHVVKAEL